MKAFGRNVNLYLMVRDPEERIKTSLTNWTGVPHKIPRTAVDRCEDNAYLKKSGIC